MTRHIGLTVCRAEWPKERHEKRLDESQSEMLQPVEVTAIKACWHDSDNVPPLLETV